MNTKYGGAEWIGEIPAAWGCVKLSRYIDIFTGNSISDGEKWRFELDEGIPYIATKDINPDFSSVDYDNGMRVPAGSDFRIAEAGSVLLCIEGGSAGKKIAFTDRDVAFVNKLCAFKAREAFVDKYLYYFICSDAFAAPFKLNITGLIGGVSQSVIKALKVILPDKETQRKIAGFLDGKCAEIDALILHEEKITGELKKYKQSVITDAVADGGTSGGQNCKKVRLKNLFTDRCGGAWGEEADNGGSGTVCIRVADFDFEKLTVKQGEKTLRSYKPQTVEKLKLQKNDLLMEKSGGGEKTPVGRAILADECEGCMYANFIDRLRIRSDYHPRFVAYLFYSLYRNGVMLPFIKQTIGIQNLDVENLLRETVCVPAFDRQRQIADYLDKKCAAIDGLIYMKRRKVEELKAYKRSIVYEYVTGKKEA